MTYQVTGAAVVLRTEDGSERYLYQGALVRDGFKAESIEHALSVGLLSEFEEVAESDPVELPAESWNNDRIDEWAAAQEPPIVFVNPVDGAKPPTKKHRLAQITAELEARKQ